jgi:hypothetical protein
MMNIKFVTGLFVNTAFASLFTCASFAQIAPNNSSFFTGNPPSLVSVQTPDNSINWPYPHYYFTISIPSNSIESVGKVTIFPQVGPSSVTFDINSTQASLGSNINRLGKSIPLTASQSSDGLITVKFNQPIPPGSIFTIVLEAAQNPSIDGIYQYTVSAFPSGSNPIGLDLGVGRISIYSFSR